MSRIFTLSRRRTLPFSFRIDSKRAFVLFLSLSQSSIKACNRPLEKVSLVDEIPAYSPYSPDVLRPLLRCNFLFNRARIEHREERGSRLSRYRRMGGGGEGRVPVLVRLLPSQRVIRRRIGPFQRVLPSFQRGM